jgi:hypothetical protein
LATLRRIRTAFIALDDDDLVSVDRIAVQLLINCDGLVILLSEPRKGTGIGADQTNLDILGSRTVDGDAAQDNRCPKHHRTA